MKNKYKGKFTISRVSSNKREDFVHVQLEDDNSMTRVVDIYLDLKEFGKAITGLSYVDCEFEHFGDKVGKKREHKAEIIPAPEFVNYHTKYPELLKPYEVDGWVGREEDLHNWHNHDGKDGIRVTFVRYVDMEDEK